MAFQEVRFPSNISRGARGGPMRKVQIVSLASGDEERNATWLNSRRRYDVAYGIRKADDLAAVVAFFEARGGQLNGFRFKDWSDYKSSLPSLAVTPFDQILATADGVAATFQLLKHYTSNVQTWTRTITKPAAGTVRVGTNTQTGPELVLNWDNPRAASWSNTGLTSTNSAVTFGSFTNAVELSSGGGGLRQAASAVVVAGRTYRARVWFQLGTATQVRLNARMQAGNLDSDIRGTPPVPAIVGQAGGVISNVTTTDLGAGVRLWSFDVTVGAGFTGSLLGFGLVGGGTVILFGASLHEPARVAETFGHSVDFSTGLVTLAGPPSAGTIVTAGYEFDVPVRFDTESIDVSLTLERAGSITSIPLIEVRR